MPLASIIDGEALLKVVVASLIATTGVTAAFSLAILGAARSAEMRRQTRAVQASAYGVLSLLMLGVFVAAVVYGIFVMTSK
jgi:uncharacterized membrane protein